MPPSSTTPLPHRVLLMVAGSAVAAYGYLLTVAADLGNGPLFAVQDGLRNQLGVSLAAAATVVGLGLVAVALALRAPLGAGTVALPQRLVDIGARARRRQEHADHGDRCQRQSWPGRLPGDSGRWGHCWYGVTRRSFRCRPLAAGGGGGAGGNRAGAGTGGQAGAASIAIYLDASTPNLLDLTVTLGTGGAGGAGSAGANSGSGAGGAGGPALGLASHASTLAESGTTYSGGTPGSGSAGGPCPSPGCVGTFLGANGPAGLIANTATI